VRSVDSKSGISRVIVLDAKGGGAPVVVATGPTAPGADAPQAGTEHRADKAAPSSDATKPATAPVAPPAALHIPPPPSPDMDPTLAQLQEMGRQIARMQAYPAAGAPPPASSGTPHPVGSTPEADAKLLTQQALSNVQALAASLKAACVGPACKR
jgi:hypothetical protein